MILSSWVALGHVGLSAAAPALQALGHRVVQLPTVMLSNHPGWTAVAGETVPTARLDAMLAALEGNGWLGQTDAVLTGYLPTAGHVDFAASLIARIRACAAAARVTVDPVLGDDPDGLYLPVAVAERVRETLVPLADILTPNRFELSWISDAPCETLDDAVSLSEALPADRVVLTSAPVGGATTGVLSVSTRDVRLWTRPRRAGVPKGAGDVLAALIAAGSPVGQALSHLDALLAASLGADHLRIAETAVRWTRVAPLAPDRWPEEE